MINRIKNFLSSIASRTNDKNIFAIGSAHFFKARQYYQNIKNLREADYKVFSQTGEDGMIDYLLYSLNIEIPKSTDSCIVSKTSSSFSPKPTIIPVFVSSPHFTDSFNIEIDLIQLD